MSSGFQPHIEVRARDQSVSSFAAILAALVARIPGSRAAALVDGGGETVDYAGHEDPYAVRLAAAHFRIVLRDAQEQSSMAHTTTLTLRASSGTFVVHALPDGYAIVLLLGPQDGSFSVGRAIEACARRLAIEAGWAQARGSGCYPVEVASDPAGRPHWLVLAGSTTAIEILGRCADTAWCESAWRVRLDFGVEATLVREEAGFWYADEPLEQLAVRRSKPAPLQNVQESR